MKVRKMTKKEHKSKISIITFCLMAITVVLIGAAVGVSIKNRELFLISMINRYKETNNSVVLANNFAKDVELVVASTVTTTAGNSSVNVRATSSNSKTIKEYRYYIKKSTNDMYVLDAIKVEEQHAYASLEPATSYDVKVEAVSYSGDTLVSTAKGETPSMDWN